MTRIVRTVAATLKTVIAGAGRDFAVWAERQHDPMGMSRELHGSTWRR